MNTLLLIGDGKPEAVSKKSYQSSREKLCSYFACFMCITRIGTEDMLLLVLKSDMNAITKCCLQKKLSVPSAL